MKEPSRHNHAYSMVFKGERASCADCGQEWFLKFEEDKQGNRKAVRWVPLDGARW